jgi:serine/threonine protein kinase
LKETVSVYGAEHANPFWVLARLKERKIKMYCGAIHGDLHPKNIVLSMRTPHLIDFGWAKGDAHIAKDFVLLECNLRFMVLHADVDRETIRQFTGWISWEGPPPKLACEYCARRVELIRCLREIARKHFPDGTVWNEEYVVPLFLVAFGLLKHFASAENQNAAEMTVLSLADYIKREVLSA